MENKGLHKQPKGIVGMLQSVYTKHPRGCETLLYTAVFALMACFVFSFFALTGKSLIWIGSPDGLSQHYNALLYFGEYLRGVTHNLFETGQFVLPLWDFSIGYGADVLTTLHYYVIGDPLNLLAGLVPAAQTELLYAALVVLRLYLAGLAFRAFCRKMGRGAFGSFCGSFLYVFSGFALYASVRHPYFINPMIYLPLLLLGAEKLLRKERPYLFIGMVFLSAMSNFYFFYALTLLLGLYILFRFFMEYKTRRVRQFCGVFAKCSGCYLIGFCMAAALFVPVAMALFGSGRVGEGPALALVYDGEYYLNLLFSFIGGDWQSRWTCLGFAAPALLCLVLLFTQRKKHTALKWGFCLLTLFLCVPVFGKIFNGFSYSTNRWSFAFAMLVAYIAAVFLPSLTRLNAKLVKAFTAFSIIYIVLGLAIPATRTASNVASYCVLAATMLFVVLSFWGQKKQKNKCRSRTARLYQVGIALCLFVGIMVNAGFRYAPSQGDYVSEFVDAGQGESLIKDSASAPIKAMEEEGFYRFEVDAKTLPVYNSALQNRVNGTDFYFSLVNGSVSDYMQAHRFVRVNDATCRGLSGRAYLDAVAGVKYFVTDSTSASQRPFGFDTLVDTYESKAYGETYYVYQSNNALPFGYTYDSTMSAKDFAALTVLEKAQAQLQTAVTEEPLPLPDGMPTFTQQMLDYQLALGEGVVQTADGFRVTKKNAAVTLTFNALPGSESYLLFDQLSYYKKNSGANYVTIKVDLNGEKQEIRVNTPNYSWYTGNHDFLTNLGSDLNGSQSLTLQFPATGEYRFARLYLSAQPTNALSAAVSKLAAEQMEVVKFSTNKVTGRIAVAEQKLLCLNLPYSQGWSAVVDGVEMPLLRVNGMFSGVILEQGTHQITLEYRTPYLNLGLVLTAVGVGSLAVLMLVTELRKKRKGY